MWTLFTEIFQTHGLVALIEAIQILAIVYLFRLLNIKDKEIHESHLSLLKMTEKRLEDVKEQRNAYVELAKQLDKSVSLLIEVFKNRGAQ